MIAVVLAFAARHWRLAAAGAAATLVLIGATALYLTGRHAGVAAQTAKLAQAQAQAAAAQVQTGVTAHAAEAADRAASKGARASAQAEEAVHDVETAPGAPDALPADVLSRWRAGVDGLRAPAAAAPDHPDR